MMMFVVRSAVRVAGSACGRGFSSRPTIEAVAESESSTHQDRGVDDVDPTMRDSDDDAPLVRRTRAEVARSPPITVGGRFAVFAGLGDCEEFD